MIATLEGPADNQAGIAKVKQGLEKYLQDIRNDSLTKTKRGGCSPAPVRARSPASPWCSRLEYSIQARGDSPGRRLSSMPLDEHYKETVRQICQTIA